MTKKLVLAGAQAVERRLARKDNKYFTPSEYQGLVNNFTNKYLT